MKAKRRAMTIARRGRHDRLIQERVHDTYKSRSKMPDPTVCVRCEAVYLSGRWQWTQATPGAREDTCPACHRIADRCPAGFLTITGDFFPEHRDELINLIRNVESKERALHPLKRIMEFKELDEGTVVTFTDPNLARGAGQALFNAYEGSLDYAYQGGEYELRVSWHRS